jgi:hypothetical protein
MSPLSPRLLPLLVVSAVMACERRAPGAADCQELAVRVVGVRDERLLEVPRVREAVIEETVKCLTVPYDRALLRCVEEQGTTVACQAAFRRRHAHEHRESADEPL